jgi:hypothetical protein
MDALQPWRRASAGALLAALALQAVLAGMMLSGAAWARTAHAAMAVILIASTAGGGLAALVNLRQVPHGRRLGLSLLALAATLAAQAVLGALSAKGFNLLWLHIPLGVALVGFATRAAVRAEATPDRRSE